MERLQAELKSAVEGYREIEQDIARNHQRRQQLTQQQHENELVAAELERLAPGDAVYKLVGPALVRQDAEEASSNVAKRLAFIGGELRRADEQLAALEERAARRQAALARLQAEAAQRGGGGSGGGGGAAATVGAS